MNNSINYWVILFLNMQASEEKMRQQALKTEWRTALEQSQAACQEARSCGMRGAKETILLLNAGLKHLMVIRSKATKIFAGTRGSARYEISVFDRECHDISVKIEEMTKNLEPLTRQGP